MIVLRFTIGQTTHEVSSDRRALLVGSDPTADVTLAHPDLAPHALALTRKESELLVELLGTDRRATLRVGDEIELAGIGVALIGLLPQAASAPLFGDYEEGLPATASAAARPRLFDLAEPVDLPALPGVPAGGVRRSPAPAAASESTPLLRADATESRGTRGRNRRRTLVTQGATTQAAAATNASATPAGGAPSSPPPEVPKFASLDFPTELLLALKRSPFYALSIGFHLLVFFILSLIYTTDAPPPKLGPGAIVASLEAEEEELSAESDEFDLDEMPAEFEELEEPALAEAIPLPEMPEQDPATPDTASQLRITDDVLEENDPPQIGLMPSLSTAARRTKARANKVLATSAARVFSKGGAGQGNQDAADIVRGQLGRGRRGNGAKLEDLDENDILVVAGSFDHIERVLDALRLKYVKVAPWSLSGERDEDFRSYKVVFWNCGESLGQRRMASIGTNLQRFVRDGGYLFTTDWGVSNVLPHAFPGYIRTNGNRAHLPEMVLHIEPHQGAQDHPLLEGVFTAGVQGKWWLEQASFDMSIGRTDAVEMLIDCPALRDQFNRSPGVAATFHYGRGRVLHAMGHYFQEAGNIAGTISSHRLALNFVLMRLDQDRKAPRR
ncbi:MAG: FHA domain-containing protein [Planctomycetota bacterium]|nr:FHA domain-containing protein [Planctomycetota bacterium]